MEGRLCGTFRLDDQIGLLSRTYRDPVLVASTDGVEAARSPFAADAMQPWARPGRHVGQRLFSASAEPLIFDYVAMNRDDPELTTQTSKGSATAVSRPSAP
jgi:phosphoribosylformylglycinamidine cyclo-ligase